MIRRPPRSTLFPTRRSSDLNHAFSWCMHLDGAATQRLFCFSCFAFLPPRRPAARSEEHTSELQSQSNLVCRLLLEKKISCINRHLPKPSSHTSAGLRPASCT